MNDSNTLHRMINVDRLVHEPARLVILTILYVVEWADFIFLLHQTGLGKGNLSSHLSRLEQAEYISIEKTYQGKKPMTICRLTKTGKDAFEAYHEQLKNYVDSVKK